MERGKTTIKEAFLLRCAQRIGTFYDRMYARDLPMIANTMKREAYNFDSITKRGRCGQFNFMIAPWQFDRIFYVSVVHEIGVEFDIVMDNICKDLSYQINSLYVMVLYSMNKPDVSLFYVIDTKTAEISFDYKRYVGYCFERYKQCIIDAIEGVLNKYLN